LSGGNSVTARLRGRYPNQTPKGSVAFVKLAIASDHAAVELKTLLADWLREQGHEVNDLGPNSTDSVDYPDFGYALAKSIETGAAELGIALCGSGIGISIAVNRNPACRCARVDEPLSAALSREHNDANVIALGARLVGPDMAKACVTAFLDTPFAGGRHARRVDKLSHPAI
jgi:ribose 5-phosphate isomerase B